MAFDPSTAELEGGGFDPSTAEPDDGARALPEGVTPSEAGAGRGRQGGPTAAQVAPRRGGTAREIRQAQNLPPAPPEVPILEQQPPQPYVEETRSKPVTDTERAQWAQAEVSPRKQAENAKLAAYVSGTGAGTISPSKAPGVVDRMIAATQPKEQDNSLVGAAVGGAGDLLRRGADVSAAGASGVWQLVKAGTDLSRMASGSWKDPGLLADVSRVAAMSSEQAQAGQSPEARQAAAGLQELIKDPNASALSVVGYALLHPQLVLNQAAESAPSMGISVVGGRLVGTLVERMSRAALGGAPLSAGAAARIAELSGTGARVGGVAGETAQAAAGVFDDIIKSGGSTSDAYRAAGLAAIGYAAIGRASGGGIVGSKAAGAREHAVKEIAKEGGEEYGQNWAEELGKAGATGRPINVDETNKQALSEGIVGAAMGAAGSINTPKQAQRVAALPSAEQMARDRGFLSGAPAPTQSPLAAEVAKAKAPVNPIGKALLEAHGVTPVTAPGGDDVMAGLQADILAQEAARQPAAAPATGDLTFDDKQHADDFIKASGLDATHEAGDTGAGWVASPKVVPQTLGELSDNQNATQTELAPGIENTLTGNEAGRIESLSDRDAASDIGAGGERIVSALRQAIGAPIVFVRGIENAGGAFLKGRAYVNVDALKGNEQQRTLHMLNIAGHETEHYFQASTDPEHQRINAAFRAVVDKYRTPGSVKARVKDERTGRPAALKKMFGAEYAKNEIDADLAGGFWADHNFWGDVIALDGTGTIAQKVFNHFMKTATRVLQAVAGVRAGRFDPNTHVTAVEPVRKAFAEAHLARRNLKAGKPAAGATPTLSRTQQAERDLFLKDSVEKGTWFHGTADDITKFRQKQAGATFLSQSSNTADEYTKRSAFWHAKQGHDSSTYGENVMPVHVRVTNPFDYEKQAHVDALIKQLGPEGEKLRQDLTHPDDNWETVERPEVQKAIKALGHDGFYVSEEGGKNLGVYDSKQIKSAIGNTGAFGQRAPTAGEAAGVGMSAEEAKAAQDEGDIRFSRSTLRPDVVAEVKGIRAVAAHLTDTEKAKLRKDTATKLVDVFKALPGADEMAAVAWAGRAKLGWYTGSFEAINHIFGKDGWRFTGLLAATSPQTSVEVNLENALRIWRNWDAAGRPQGRSQILAIMGRSVQGNKGEDSVLDAWVNNTVNALTAKSFGDLVLSGPKVDSFMRNLQGDLAEVTNDAWIANYALVEQTLFSGSANKAGTEPGKGFGYMAMSAKTRAAAKVLSKETGRSWQPAEVQETVWSWAMSMLESMDAKGETRGASQMLDAGLPSDSTINATPDFRTLFHSPRYAEIIESMGKSAELASLKAAPTQAVDPGKAPFDDAKQRKLAEQAGLRLEMLVRQRRTNVQISWEARPGESTGVLPGVHTAPLELQEKFLADVFAAIEGADFKDMLGFSLRDTLFGPSAWQGKVLAGAQTSTRPGVVGVEGKTVKVDAKTRDKLSRVAATLGYVLNQEGVYWHWPIYMGNDVNTANGFEIQAGRSFTNAEMARLYGIINRRAGHTMWAPANTSTGARILNFTDTPNRAFHRTIKAAADEFAKKFDGHLDTDMFSSDGDPIENNWQEKPDGHDYTQRIGKGGRSDLQGWATGPLQDAVNAVFKQYSEEHGWGPWRREDVQRPGGAAESDAPATPLSRSEDPRAKYDGITVKQQIRIADTGDVATLSIDAGKALRDLDERADTFRKLLGCLK